MRYLMKSMVLALSLFFLAVTGVSAANPQVNMNVTNGEVRDVLTALATIGEVNVVVDDSVSGNITIQLKNIPFETALDLVTKTKGLTYQRIGDVIVVGDSQQLGRNFGSVHFFKLQYADPASTMEILSLAFPESGSSSGGGKPAEVKLSSKGTADSAKTGAAPGNKSTPAAGGRFKVDTATNMLVFYGTAVEAEQVGRLLSELDIPYQQVSLEAQVVAVNKDKTKELGIEWTWEATPQWPDVESPKVTTNSDGQVIAYEPGKVTRQSRSGIIQFGRTPEGIPYEFYYQAKINALASNGDAKILARPKITTLNGQQARILIGDRIPVLNEKTENGKTTTTIEYIDAGIKLTFTPRINNQGLITADVYTEVSTPTLVSEMKAYRITTREAETKVRMKDGETMVIGGLIGSTSSDTKRVVPFLSDIPLLGWLFKNSNHYQSETEVMIFLTARIVK
ncbi:secretin and TonB N-terminal domain-containing protein [Sporomusa sp.]|uniref:secretin and TonB N-terminal domain-containing protein n=1 Tax=Sporomusa sp. TaxID=2078658 RepID=UPI002CC0D356|nr:secretin and TonB N-terminal domain-containing protein [Sporomusa sp.]HWR43640.1 secretin and TonB N-terminal domain-containing protein [Sporomusa sp.]